MTGLNPHGELRRPGGHIWEIAHDLPSGRVPLTLSKQTETAALPTVNVDSCSCSCTCQRHSLVGGQLTLAALPPRV
jgi:hypothetical protein